MSDFKNFFLRPNLSNSGSIPATGATYVSPDICIGGITPISDFQKVLKTADSYASEIDHGTAAKVDNFCYLRAKNHLDNASTTDAYLYYSFASCVQWPSNWKNNGIPTDLGNLNFANSIKNVPAGGIGVVERPFIWHVPTYPATNDHYCLIARLTSDSDPNDIPNIYCSVDMAALIRNNLRWSQRNITMLKSDHPETSFQYVLDIPIDTKDPTHTYQTQVSPVNLTGCELELKCSVNDSDGRPISVSRTKITKDYGQIEGSKNRLEPGFRGLVVVYLYNPNHIPIPYGSGMEIEYGYMADQSELPLAESYHILDSEYQERAYQTGVLDRTEIKRLVKIGGYLGRMKK